MGRLLPPTGRAARRVVLSPRPAAPASREPGLPTVRGREARTPVETTVARKRLEEMRDDLDRTIAILHGERPGPVAGAGYPQDSADAGSTCCPRPTAPRRFSTPPAASATRYSPRSPASTTTATVSASTAGTRSPRAGSKPGPRPPRCVGSPGQVRQAPPQHRPSRGDDPPQTPPAHGGLPAPPYPPAARGLAGRYHQLRAERLVGPGRQFGPHELGQAAGVASQPVRHHRLGEHGPRADPVDPQPGPAEQLAGLVRTEAPGDRAVPATARAPPRRAAGRPGGPSDAGRRARPCRAPGSRRRRAPVRPAAVRGRSRRSSPRRPGVRTAPGRRR